MGQESEWEETEDKGTLLLEHSFLYEVWELSPSSSRTPLWWAGQQPTFRPVTAEQKSLQWWRPLGPTTALNMCQADAWTKLVTLAESARKEMDMVFRGFQAPIPATWGNAGGAALFSWQRLSFTRKTQGHCCEWNTINALLFLAKLVLTSPRVPEEKKIDNEIKEYVWNVSKVVLPSFAQVMQLRNSCLAQT